jgi:hypothetical protein
MRRRPEAAKATIRSEPAPGSLSYGTEEQKRRWLPPMAAGTAIAGLAMTRANPALLVRLSAACFGLAVIEFAAATLIAVAALILLPRHVSGDSGRRCPLMPPHSRVLQVC